MTTSVLRRLFLRGEIFGTVNIQMKGSSEVSLTFIDFVHDYDYAIDDELGILVITYHDETRKFIVDVSEISAIYCERRA